MIQYECSYLCDDFHIMNLISHMDPSANHLQIKKKQISIFQPNFDTTSFYFIDSIYPDDAGVDAKSTSYISYV